MSVTYRSILVPTATCDVCGKGPLSFYSTIGEQRELTTDEVSARTDGSTDPRVKVVMCITCMPSTPFVEKSGSFKVDGRTTAARRRKSELSNAKIAGDRAAGRI